MKRLGKLILGVAVLGALGGGAWWWTKQQAAQDPAVRYKLATSE